MSKPDPDKAFQPADRIKPADLRVECHACGGSGRREMLKGVLSKWNGTGCTTCMGHGVHMPRKVDI